MTVSERIPDSFYPAGPASPEEVSYPYLSKKSKKGKGYSMLLGAQIFVVYPPDPIPTRSQLDPNFFKLQASIKGVRAKLSILLILRRFAMTCHDLP